MPFNNPLKKLSNASLLVMALSLVLIGRHIFSHGMFLDGIVYSTIARNFAFSDSNNYWQFWTQNENDFFQSHPPLAFWLQSLLFSLFGDHFWIDRLYSILCLLVSLFLIKKIWQLLVPSFPQGAYWVQFFYLLLPLVSWSFNNNLLENTLNCFILASIWMYILQGKRQSYLYGVLAGLFIFGATLTKGPVGLFPIIFPILYYICFRENSFRENSFQENSFQENSFQENSFQENNLLKVALQIIIPFLMLLLTWVLLLQCSSEAYSYFLHYSDIQLFKSLAGHYDNKSNRFYIIIKLFLQLIIYLGIGIGLFLLFKRQITDRINQQYAALFLLVGLSASLPIAISPKQMEFYLLPSLVFFALAFVFFCMEQIKELDNYIQTRKSITFLSVACILFSISSVVFLYGNYYRDEEILNDVFIAGTYTAENQTIGTSFSIQTDWSFQTYLSRYFRINGYTKEPVIYIQKKGEAAPENYILVSTKSNLYSFYHKK